MLRVDYGYLAFAYSYIFFGCSEGFALRPLERSVFFCVFANFYFKISVYFFFLKEI